jgi:H+-transporting ATPase
LGVICGLLVFNAVVGFLQEYQAGNIVAQLKSQLALHAMVVRDGKRKQILGAELVPGDIIYVDEGSIIPADSKVIDEDAYLQLDQSALTGESLAVEKAFGDDVYSSSAVKRGDSLLMVTSTGDFTYVGRTAALTGQAAGKGRFTEVLNSIGVTLLILVIIFILIVWIAGFFRNQGIVDLLTDSLILTVIGVPVGCKEETRGIH